MRNEYDFSKSVKNPYAKHLKKQVTLRLGVDVIEYFKNLSEETGVPYAFYPIEGAGHSLQMMNAKVNGMTLMQLALAFIVEQQTLVVED